MTLEGSGGFVEVRRGVCAYCDVVTNRNTQPAWAACYCQAANMVEGGGGPVAAAVVHAAIDPCITVLPRTAAQTEDQQVAAMCKI